MQTLKELLEQSSNEDLKDVIEFTQALLEQRKTTPSSEDQRKVKFDNIRVVKDKTGKFVMVVAPYHPDLVRECRALNGKWQPGNTSWVFDGRDEDRVRQMVTDIFGTDGKEPVEVCDVEMTLIGSQTNDKNRFALGREIVARPARDSRVKLGDNVTIISGSFKPSCGSRNHPAVMRYGEEPVVILVRDVPKVLAQKAVTDDPDTYRIV